MAEHTPGPWKTWDRIKSVSGILVTDDSGNIGVCRAIQHQTGGEKTPDMLKLDADVCRANARLIAAAPDLLAALKEVDLPVHNPQWPAFDELDECPEGHDYECGGCVMRRRILAVIANAEGRS